MKLLLENENIAPEKLLSSDEELQKIYNEISLTEKNCSSMQLSSDSDFAKEIHELQNSKISLLKRSYENIEINEEEIKFMKNFVKGLLRNVVEKQ